MITRYVHIPQNKAYYKATEDCCYEIVSYDEKNRGVTQRIERAGLEIFNAQLLCCCDDGCTIISEQEYNSVRELILG